MMNLTRKLWVVILTPPLIGVGAVWFTLRGAHTDGIKTLKLGKYFPAETDSILLVHPWSLDMDSSKNIYVCDARLNAIVKFTKDGKFVKEIGRQGQGPGEFEMPFEFCYDKDKLFIWDQGNRRVQIFNSNGSYLSSFKVFRTLGTISHFDNTIVASLNYEIEESDQFTLITLFTPEGVAKKTFGKSINDLVKIPQLPPKASDVLLKTYNDKIYVLFRYYPFLQIYTQGGSLLKTFHFNEKMYRHLISDNYSPEKILESYPPVVRLRFLFLAMDVNNEGFFLCTYKDDIEIHHYGFNGELIEKFLYKQPKQESYVRGIKIFYEARVHHFYVLNFSPIPRIEVYATEKHGQ